jgi:hypothetical protein
MGYSSSPSLNFEISFPKSAVLTVLAICEVETPNLLA